MQTSSRVRVLSGGRFLQIDMAELSDRAQYTCVATNIHGMTRQQYNLAVHGKATSFIYNQEKYIYLLLHFSQVDFSHILWDEIEL